MLLNPFLLLVKFLYFYLFIILCTRSTELFSMMMHKREIIVPTANKNFSFLHIRATLSAQPFNHSPKKPSNAHAYIIAPCSSRGCADVAIHHRAYVVPFDKPFLKTRAME